MKKLLFAALVAATPPLAPAMAQTAPAPAMAAAPAPAAKPEFHYFAATDYLPQRVLAMPPARGSQEEARELEFVRKEIAAASPERLAQAAWDDTHEDPTLFNAVLGRDLTRLPATWALLLAVQNEADAAADQAKEAFGRMRPFGIDETIKTCVKANPAKALRSYPSGHATVGYSVGWALARLMPDFAPYILDRAHDYAESRVICGVHFASDVEASHVLATVVTERLLADPRMADKVAAARAELNAR